ncbi:hypothetical protein [Arundinibacter roseus]|uniref:Uncharacterized protein n=1 Tax=Arundinibacter roseus TaxID=2070510 RepID=A0A4R4K9B6_9BACT|nr:hypothetical protein [Arundinibacter roseus]TDB64073.1 hypothetical protein EZE20_14110 [Arundinibacter roseus]
MQKISTLCLLATIVVLGSCGRQYPTFNQMPVNAHYEPRERVQPVAETPTVVAEAPSQANEATPAVSPIVSSVSEGEVLAGIESDERMTAILAEKSPKQIDQQLENALASAEGQKLLARPAVAAQIEKVRSMLAQTNIQKVNPSEVQVSKASKLVDKSIRKHMGPSAAKALNRDLKIGLILIAVAILVGLIPGLGLVSLIVGVIGVVFVILGLIAL